MPQPEPALREDVSARPEKYALCGARSCGLPGLLQTEGFAKYGESAGMCRRQADPPVPVMECSVGLNRLRSFADLVSDYEGFQTTVLRYGLLDGQSGSFFSSFRPHVRATLRLTA